MTPTPDKLELALAAQKLLDKAFAIGDSTVYVGSARRKLQEAIEEVARIRPEAFPRVGKVTFELSVKTQVQREVE